jgi:hypothetical protein
MCCLKVTRRAVITPGPWKVTTLFFVSLNVRDSFPLKAELNSGFLFSETLLRGPGPQKTTPMVSVLFCVYKFPPKYQTHWCLARQIFLAICGWPGLPRVEQMDTDGHQQCSFDSQ